MCYGFPTYEFIEIKEEYNYKDNSKNIIYTHFYFLGRD